MVSTDMRPPLFFKGHALYVTSAFPPSPGGSCVLNQNFLDGFDPASFTVVTHDSQLKKIEVNGNITIEKVIRSFQRLGRYNRLVARFQRPLAKWKLKRLARKKNAKLIIGTYPNLYFLGLANEVAQELQIPFAAYLHDTILEANLGNKLESEARAIQEVLFQTADRIFVMSDGMKELFAKKYGLTTFPLRHTYLEPITAEVDENRVFSPSRFFWGGAIYDINSWTLSRFSSMLPSGGKMELATNTSIQRLESAGFCLDKIIHTFYANRAAYLKAIGNSDFLILALDPAEHTNVNQDEIGTIFPTKTPEYLASGIPILVICPEEYFLSRFFKRYDCGYVVNDLREKSIGELFEHIRRHPGEVRGKISNALKVAKNLFDFRVVRDTFIDDISSL